MKNYLIMTSMLGVLAIVVFSTNAPAQSERTPKGKSIVRSSPPADASLTMVDAQSVDPDSLPDSDFEVFESVEVARQSVNAQEARRQLRRLRQMARLERQLSRDEPDNFAGIKLDGPGRGKIKVRFKRDPAATLTRRTRESGVSLDADVVAEVSAFSTAEVEQMAATLNTLIERQELQASVGGTANNGLIVTVPDRAKFDEALATASITLPAFVEVRIGEWRLKTMSNVPAAMRMSGCTSGFAIRQQSTAYVGFATAGHCENAAGAVAGINPTTSSVPYGAAQGEKIGSGFDFQWHSPSSAHSVTPWVNLYDGRFAPIRSYVLSDTLTTSTPLTVVGSATGRAMNATLYNKVRIAFTSNTGVNYGSGYLEITPTSPDDNLALNGDSGGVVFSGTTAVGIIVAQSKNLSNNAIFMPIDKVVGIGYTILAAPP